MVRSSCDDSRAERALGINTRCADSGCFCCLPSLRPAAFASEVVLSCCGMGGDLLWRKCTAACPIAGLPMTVAHRQRQKRSLSTHFSSPSNSLSVLSKFSAPSSSKPGKTASKNGRVIGLRSSFSGRKKSSNSPKMAGRVLVLDRSKKGSKAGDQMVKSRRSPSKERKRKICL